MAMALDVPTPCVFFSGCYSLQKNCSFGSRGLVGNIWIIRWNAFADSAFVMFVIFYAQRFSFFIRPGPNQRFHITLKQYFTFQQSFCKFLYIISFVTQ